MWINQFPIRDVGCGLSKVALLKAKVSLQVGKSFSSDNGISVSIIYSYMQ